MLYEVITEHDELDEVVGGGEIELIHDHVITSYSIHYTKLYEK